MVELYSRTDTVAGAVLERWTLRLFKVAGWILFAGGMIEYCLDRPPFSWGIYGAGLLLALISIKLRRAARAELGRYWSFHIELRDSQPLVTSGPFRLMRHPVYFSMILELLAGALILRAWIALAACMVVFVPALLARMKNEETAMIQRFGEAYLSYRRRTPAIVPSVFRWS